MQVLKKPDVTNRASLKTSRKREVQSNVVCQILSKLKDKDEVGDFYQTPGPGHVSINYALFQPLLGTNSKYYMVEYFNEHYEAMLPEYKKLKTKAKKDIYLKCGELFATILNAKANSISFIDACLTVTPTRMIENGILRDLAALLASDKTKKTWFFSLTFCLRGDRRLLESIKYIKNLMSYCGATVIHHENYRDGSPMGTIVWECHNNDIMSQILNNNSSI
jgi:hypothetical protein